MSEHADSLDATRLREHAAWLRGLAHTLARGAEAEDLAQETWRVALERAPSALDEGRLRGWLTTVARRLALRGRRDAAAHRAHEERWATERGDAGAGDPGERALLHKHIADAVHALEEPYRGAVVLRYFDGLDARALAERQGVSHDAARQRLARALAMLRARLDREYGGGRAQWAALALPGFGERVATAPWITGGAWMIGKMAVVVVVAGAAMWWWWSVGSAGRAEPAGTAPAEFASTSSRAVDEAFAGSSAPAESAQRAYVPGSADAPPARAIDRERDLHGIVVDRERRQVAGARVLVVQHAFAELEFLDLDPERRASSRLEVTEQATNPAGEFAIPLDPGRSYDLVVTADGFAPGAASHCHAGEKVVITLDAGASVHGRVLRAGDDAPIAGATVELHYARELDSMRTSDAVRVETDAAGRYRIDGLPAGERLLGAFPRVDAASGWVVLTLAAGRSIEQDFRVEAGHRLRGRVLDRETRAPIAGAIVGEGWMPRRTVHTDAHGEFELPGSTTRGTYQIAVRATGFGRVDREVRVHETEHPEVVEVLLDRGRILRGRVVERSGAPVEGAIVIAAALLVDGASSLQQHDVQSTRTAADGTYEIADVRRDLHHALFVRRPGFGAASYELDDQDAEGDVLTIPDVVLVAGSIVRGVVRDERGEPQASRVVHLKGRNRDATQWNEATRSPASDYLDHRSTRTDDLGRFAFADVAAGDYELSAPLRNVEPGGRVRFTLAESEPARDVVLTVRGGLAISGRVVGPDGAGVHAWIAFDSAEDPRGLVQQYTEQDGSFEVRGLVNGDYSVRAYPTYLDSAAASARLASASVADVAAGSADLVVRVERAAPLRGRVLEADGTPAANVNVEARRGALALTSGLTDADGAFLLWVAEGGGPYELRATARIRQDGAEARAQEFPPESAPAVRGAAPGEWIQHVIRLP